MEQSSENRLQHWLRHSWWVILFVALSCAVYGVSKQHKQTIIASLDEQIAQLDQAKRKALEMQEDLLLQVDSQSDPAWVELTLMRVLGLVPEGYSKVYFYKENPPSSGR